VVLVPVVLVSVVIVALTAVVIFVVIFVFVPTTVEGIARRRCRCISPQGAVESKGVVDKKPLSAGEIDGAALARSARSRAFVAAEPGLAAHGLVFGKGSSGDGQADALVVNGTAVSCPALHDGAAVAGERLVAAPLRGICEKRAVHNGQCSVVEYAATRGVAAGTPRARAGEAERLIGKDFAVLDGGGAAVDNGPAAAAAGTLHTLVDTVGDFTLLERERAAEIDKDAAAVGAGFLAAVQIQIHQRQGSALSAVAEHFEQPAGRVGVERGHAASGRGNCQADGCGSRALDGQVSIVLAAVVEMVCLAAQQLDREGPARLVCLLDRGAE
jgi:hypothetical protein